MTEKSSFKRHVRERMAKTGESYTGARSQVTKKRERVNAARARLTADAKTVSDQKLKEATGRTWAAWLSLLDRWGARERKHGATVDFLMTEHGVESWYAQAITVGFERATGRLKHQQADGFTISASKTIGVPADVAFDAFVNARKRKKWLPDVAMSLRTSQPGRTARFDWGDGTTRVMVSFDDKGPSKTTVAVAHERLPDPDEAENAKAMWRQRLVELKSLLES